MPFLHSLLNEKMICSDLIDEYVASDSNSMVKKMHHQFLGQEYFAPQHFCIFFFSEQALTFLRNSN